MRILVAEDERSMASLLCQGLEEEGHAVTLARDGRHALEMAEAAVTVSTEYREEDVVLPVADTGEGIAESDLPHVFERFYRADAARGSGSGFGLGLAIAHAIAQVHGSTITVESRPGAGARFRLALKF